MVALPRALTPLRHRPFLWLTVGQTASNVGDAFYAVALPWYVLNTHGGALLLGTVLAAYGIPRTVFMAFGGRASDRWHPWTVMLGADLVRAVAVVTLAVTAFAGPAHPAVLIPIAAVIGAGEGMFVPASFAITPELLPAEQLQAGNAITSGGTQLATLVGPAVGGAAVAFLGPAAAFAVDGLSFLVSAATLAGIAVDRRHARSVTPASGDDPGSAAGERRRTVTIGSLVRSERVLQLILIVLITANLGSGGMSEVALPVLVHGPLHAGAAGYGAVIAAYGGGALIGTLAAGQAGGARRPAVVASIAYLVGAVALAATPFAGGIVLAALALGVFGATASFGDIITITAFQLWAPPALLGRLMGLLMLASDGVFPLSVLVAGTVVHTTGPAPFFLLAGGALALSLIVALTQPVWRRFGAPAAR